LRFDHLGCAVGGEADDCGGAYDFAGVGGGEVFLAEVESYGFVFSDLFSLEEGGVVGSVVDDEEGFRLSALGGQMEGEGVGFAGPWGFVAELEDLGSGFEEGFGGEGGGDLALGESGGVQYRIHSWDWVDGREVQVLILA